MTATARKSPRRTQIPREENGGFTVNASLTAKRQIEAAEYAAMVKRVIAALGRRAASGDGLALQEMSELEAEVRRITGLAVRALHDQERWSWGEIGLYCGVTKQAAQQRWGRQ